MRGRSFAIVGWCLLSIWVLSGCAGNQGVSDRFDVTNHPQLFLPGANRADVKGLAMGTARAKGWIIVQSTDDRLVMQRPLDPSSPSAPALGAAKSSVPPVIEVTSAFVEQSGGVTVALGATLITQPSGEKSPQRIDYTERYRGALTQSLESLRANWTANRQRVANAMPPTSPKPESAPGAAAAENNNPLVQVWGQTVAEATPAGSGTPAMTTAPTPASNRAPTQRSPSQDRATDSPLPSPVSTLQWSASSPAPVADGSSALNGDGSAATPAPAVRTTPLQPTPEPTVVRTQPKVTRPEAQTAKAASGTAKPAAKGAKTDSKAAKPAAKGANTDSKVAKPAAKGAKTDSKVAKPGAKGAKTDSKPVKPVAKGAKIDSKVVKPAAKGAKTDSKPAKPGAKHPQVDKP